MFARSASIFASVAGQANRLVSAFRDHVDRIRKLEEHQRFTQKIEVIGTLAGGMAHDFNNILTYMLAYARLAMADLPADAPAREKLREIIAGIHRAGELIRRLVARRPIDSCRAGSARISALSVGKRSRS